MGNEQPFGSEGLSRRAILESLGGGGLFAGLQSVLTNQARAQTYPFGDDTGSNDEDFEITAGEAAEEIATAAASNLYQRAVDLITGAFQSGDVLLVGDIATELSNVVADLPEPVEALEWLGENLEAIQNTIANPPEDDEGDLLWSQSSPSADTVSPAPKEIVGSTVDGTVASSGSVSPSSADGGGFLDGVREAATNHFSSVTSALGNDDVWSELQNEISDLTEYFGRDRLGDVIEDPIQAIRPAVEAVVDAIMSPLKSLADVFDAETADDVLDGGINITAPLATNGDDLSVSLETFESELRDDLDSNTNSIDGSHGVATSRAPSSASGDTGNHSEESTLEDITPPGFSLRNQLDFDSNAATVDRSERGGTAAGVTSVQVSSPPSDGSDICGARPGGGSGLESWSQYAGFAQDTSSNVLNEYFADNSQGPGQPVGDAAKPCPPAPGGTVRAFGYNLSLSGAENQYFTKPLS
jgi:hypothetical protein